MPNQFGQSRCSGGLIWHCLRTTRGQPLSGLLQPIRRIGTWRQQFGEALPCLLQGQGGLKSHRGLREGTTLPGSWYPGAAFAVCVRPRDRGCLVAALLTRSKSIRPSVCGLRPRSGPRQEEGAYNHRRSGSTPPPNPLPQGEGEALLSCARFHPTAGRPLRPGISPRAQEILAGARRMPAACGVAGRCHAFPVRCIFHRPVAGETRLLRIRT
jgi:hypothetical protein